MVRDRGIIHQEPTRALYVFSSVRIVVQTPAGRSLGPTAEKAVPYLPVFWKQSAPRVSAAQSHSQARNGQSRRLVLSTGFGAAQRCRFTTSIRGAATRFVDCADDQAACGAAAKAILDLARDMADQTKSCELEHVPPRSNRGDSREAKDRRVYRH
jgi:hypothetical protein